MHMFHICSIDFACICSLSLAHTFHSPGLSEEFSAACQIRFPVYRLDLRVRVWFMSEHVYTWCQVHYWISVIVRLHGDCDCLPLLNILSVLSLTVCVCACVCVLGVSGLSTYSFLVTVLWGPKALIIDLRTHILGISFSFGDVVKFKLQTCLKLTVEVSVGVRVVFKTEVTLQEMRVGVVSSKDTTASACVCVCVLYWFSHSLKMWQREGWKTSFFIDWLAVVDLWMKWRQNW